MTIRDGVLVTGASGFVGGYVTRRIPGCVPLDDDGGVVDLTDSDRVRRSVERLEFGAVIHLAAQTFVPDSFRNPGETFEVNVVGTVNLLAALAGRDFRGRFLYVSSGEVYGAVSPDALPITEEGPLRPRNPYAASKAAAEAACAYWNAEAGFDVLVARPFNHIGPGQSARFAIADFARQLVEIRLGRRPPVLEVGNVDVTRDFTDVRDVVDAYRAIIARGVPGRAYNVCSGEEQGLKDLILQMGEILGIDVEVRVDPERLRPTDQPRVRGSFDRLAEDTGWRPRVPIRQSLAEILDSYLEESSE